jgi:hypothetical protein
MLFSHLFTGKNKDRRTYYLGIFLREKSGEVWIIEENNFGANLKVKKNFYYSNGFENIVEDVDSALAILEEGEKFLNDVEKTIFFLSGFFIDESGLVKKIYLAKLKDLVKKLELTPLGYIEITTALVDQLEKKEGIPLSLICLEIEKTAFKFLLKKAGRIIFQKEYPKTDNFIIDFYDALNQVKEHIPLPVRVVICDDEPKTERELLLNHTFKEDYFIQPPRIEIVDKQLIEKMLITSFSEQLRLNQSSPIKAEVYKEVASEKKEVTGKTVMGFVIGSDIQEKEERGLPNSSREKETFAARRPWGLSAAVSKFFNKMQSWMMQLTSHIATKKLKLSGWITFGVFVILCGIFIDEYFFHKADVTVYLPKKEVKDQIEIISPIESLNKTKATSNIEEVINVTGEKTVGEKARGEVNIYNYTFTEKSFNAGMGLEFNGLSYVLEEGVKVASASQVGEMRQPGKVKASISATFIGEEGNLKKGNVFKIGDFPIDNFFAKNDADLSGGSKKKVRFFSLEDKERLDRLVSQSIEKKALAYYEEKKKNNDNYFYLKDLTKIEIKQRNISKEVGEEADKVSEVVTADITYYRLGKDYLLGQVVVDLKNKLPKGYVVNTSDIKYDLAQIKKDNTNIKLFFDYRGYGVKKIDNDIIKKNLVFFPEKDLKKLFKDQYRIEKVDFVNKKNVPLFRGRLPFFIKNINLIETVF